MSGSKHVAILFKRKFDLINLKSLRTHAVEKSQPTRIQKLWPLWKYISFMLAVLMKWEQYKSVFVCSSVTSHTHDV